MVVGGIHAAELARPTTVVAFDDRPVCARGLRMTLDEAADRVHLIGVLDSVHAFNGIAADVALLSTELRDGSRLADNVALLRQRGLLVLICTDTCDVGQLSEAFGAGAAGVVCKYHSEEMLLDGIRLVHRGETFIPADVAQLMAEGAAQRPRLSAREIDVLNLLYQGLITKQAARRLQVSESTVKEHLKRVRQKYTALGRTVSTRVQLLQVAHRDGFITTDGVIDE
jgi:DNA-binding NarL/FixJ family response regulator